MSTYKVTLQYANGDTWFAGIFKDKESADTWIATEQKRPYWSQYTKVIIEEIASNESL